MLYTSQTGATDPVRGGLVGLSVARSGETSSGGKKVSSDKLLWTFFLFIEEEGGPMLRLTRNIRIPFPADDLTAELRSERILRGAREKVADEGVEGGCCWGCRDALVGAGEGDRRGKGKEGEAGREARLVDEKDIRYCEDVDSDNEGRMRLGVDDEAVLSEM